MYTRITHSSAASLRVTCLVWQAHSNHVKLYPQLRHNSSSNKHSAPVISLVRHLTLTLVTHSNSTVCYVLCDDSAIDRLTVGSIQRSPPCSRSRTPWKSGFEACMADGHDRAFVSCCPMIRDPIFLNPKTFRCRKGSKTRQNV